MEVKEAILGILKELWKNIVISILTAVIVTWIISFFTDNPVYIILALNIMFLGGIIYFFKIVVFNSLFAKKINHNHIMDEIYKECYQAKWINIFVMKGGIFTKQDLLYKIFGKDFYGKDIKFVMANPDSSAIPKRATEIYNRSPKHLKEETKISLETMEELLKTSHNLYVKTHNETALVRLVYTEKIMFFSFFLPQEYAANAPFYKVNSQSPIYILGKKYFEDIYDNKSEKIGGAK